MIELRDYQKEALDRMHNGCILVGGVGSGKSITSLAYYYTVQARCSKTGSAAAKSLQSWKEIKFIYYNSS